jgi:hypothetical protein
MSHNLKEEKKVYEAQDVSKASNTFRQLYDDYRLSRPTIQMFELLH